MFAALILSLTAAGDYQPRNLDYAPVASVTPTPKAAAVRIPAKPVVPAKNIDPDHTCDRCGTHANVVVSEVGDWHSHQCGKCGNKWWHPNPGSGLVVAAPKAGPACVCRDCPLGGCAACDCGASPYGPNYASYQLPGLPRAWVHRDVIAAHRAGKYAVGNVSVTDAPAAVYRLPASGGCANGNCAAPTTRRFR